MDASLYQRAREVFLAAVDAPDRERSGIVRKLCGEDAELAKEVEELLAADAQPSPATVAAAAGALRSLEGSSSLVGETVGHFRIVREIGSGGMGRVYEASQELPRRAVALKVMRPFLGTPAILRRFEFEIEVLARLQHPGIAQVFEAGTLRSGDEAVPWFAMELVEGARALDVYAREEGVGLRPRLRLFGEICDAVHYGHQRGIVHRDLKPGNVLVDREGRPKVIDFGVAKSTNSDVALTTLHTQVGEIVGTLQYMSPEQCDGNPDAIDARSDVYSLGVLLYELVCERLPYEVARMPLSAAARVVREQDPERPSAIRRVLRGDLEAILLRAIEKQPERRYSSAAALAEDVRRFLTGRPVEARSPGAWLRLTRWMARHPVGTTAAACTALVALTVGAMLLGAQLLGRVPDRVFVAPDRSFARLESRAGVRLENWDVGGPGALCFAGLCERPEELGGGQVVVLGAREGATWAHGPELCVFDSGGAGRLLWTTGEHPLVEPPDKQARPESRFCCSIVLFEDVLDGSPGKELVVVHRNSTYSAQTIRVFDLSGRLRYQAWNDGALFDLHWLPGSRRLVATGLDSEKRWQDVGCDFAEAGAQYPAIVFALDLRDGRTDDNRWIVRGGRRQDETLAWYQWFGPAASLGVLEVVVPRISVQATSFDPSRSVKIDFNFWNNSPRAITAGLHFVLDGEGRVLTRHGDDGYDYWRASGLLPPESTYELLPYERMPR